MATINHQLKGIRLYAIVLLRIVIGWHFLFEGISKLFSPAWSSADFLLLSNWIFKDFFHWIAENSGVLAVADFLVIWGLIIIGLTLFIGLFDRIISIAGMALLALFWLANPPLTAMDFGLPREGNYLIVDKNLVELFGLLIISLFPTGKILGIEIFISREKTKQSVDVPNTATPNTEKTEASESNKLDRRAVIRGLSSLPVLGVFGYALLKQKQWESYEEKNLVDAVTGASAKTFNNASLKELKGQVPHAKIKYTEFSRIILGGTFFQGGLTHVTLYMCHNL